MNKLSRRTFFTAAAGLAASARTAKVRAQGANTRVRIAIIGTGGRARGLMNQLKRFRAPSRSPCATSTSRACSRRRRSPAPRR